MPNLRSKSAANRTWCFLVFLQFKSQTGSQQSHTDGAKITAYPGWKWSESIGKVKELDRCPSRHVGYVISGSMVAQDEDGNEMQFDAGDVYLIEPGHDGWVVGDEPCVSMEFNEHWESKAKS